MTTTYTVNLNLAKPDFDSTPWHDLVNNNFDQIDALMFSLFGVGNLKGGWQNSTLVSVGERYYDAADGAFFEVLVQHTTASSPTTFATDRTNNPTYWKSLDISEALDAASTATTKADEAAASADAAAASNSAVQALEPNITNLSAITAAISDVAAIDSNIVTISAIDAEITAVAGIAADVTAVSAIDSEVTAVAGDATDIGTVAGNITNVNTVAGISGNVTTVAGISANVTTVAGAATNVGTVAGVAADVSTVAGISAAVSTVAADGTDIGTVAGISADISALAAIASDISAVEDIAANVTSVAADATDIGTVATNIADVNTVATNIADVINAGAIIDGFTSDDVGDDSDYGTGSVTAALNQAKSDIETNASAITGKANTSHTHNADDINAGTLADARLPARLNTLCQTITDWNDATTNGFFMGDSASNGPTTGWYYGWVVAHNANYVTQTVIRFTGDYSRWCRDNNNGNWSSWVQMTDANGAPLGGGWTFLASAGLSGTGATVTGIPSDVNEILVVGRDVSGVTYGNMLILVKLGDSGGIETTGYFGSSPSGIIGWSLGAVSETTEGMIRITRASADQRRWVAIGCGGASPGVYNTNKVLSNTLTQLRIELSQPGASFDGGAYYVYYI